MIALNNLKSLWDIDWEPIPGGWECRYSSQLCHSDRPELHIMVIDESSELRKDYWVALVIDEGCVYETSLWEYRFSLIEQAIRVLKEKTEDYKSIFGQVETEKNPCKDFHKFCVTGKL
jgi:hypothetical protein